MTGERHCATCSCYGLDPKVVGFCDSEVERRHETFGCLVGVFLSGPGSSFVVGVGSVRSSAAAVSWSTLPRPTLDQVRAWQRKPRTAIRRVGRRALRNEEALREFRGAVCLRAEGCCEAQGLAGPLGAVCRSQRHSGSHAHHVWPEDRRYNRHDPERGLWLCFVAHRWTHDHPAEAQALGLLRPESFDG